MLNERAFTPDQCDIWAKSTYGAYAHVCMWMGGLAQRLRVNPKVPSSNLACGKFCILPKRFFFFSRMSVTHIHTHTHTHTRTHARTRINVCRSWVSPYGPGYESNKKSITNKKAQCFDWRLESIQKKNALCIVECCLCPVQASRRQPRGKHEVRCGM